MGQVLREIAEENLRQDEKWGEQNHDPHLWLAILMEEIGEFAKASLSDADGGDGNMREEAIQIAAVAVAMIECFDRQAAIAAAEPVSEATEVK